MKNISIQEVIKTYSSYIMGIPGVAGIAEGKLKGRSCIRVFVLEKDSKILKELPTTLDGYQVIIEETEEFHALNT